MQLMWEALPGNAMLKTDSSIVTKNGYIQCALLSNSACVAAASLITGQTTLYMPAFMGTYLKG